VFLSAQEKGEKEKVRWVLSGSRKSVEKAEGEFTINPQFWRWCNQLDARHKLHPISDRFQIIANYW